jgi:hypothetical protein
MGFVGDYWNQVIKFWSIIIFFIISPKGSKSTYTKEIISGQRNFFTEIKTKHNSIPEKTVSM